MDNQLSLSLLELKSPVKPLHARVPKDWLLKPVFIPGLQPKNREIMVNGNKWIMGVNNPLSKKPEPSRDITLAHIKVALGVLTFFHGHNPVSISVTELAKRCADSRGGRYYRDLLQKLNDLRDYWVSVTYENGDTKTFTLLKSIAVLSKAPKKKPIGKNTHSESQLWLDSVELHEEFADLMSDFARTMHLRFDTMKKLTSDIAQSIYLFLPSRAYHHSKEAPFEITLTLLFEQLGLDRQPKSVRYKLLTQHKNSVINQLDHAEILTGCLRVKLKETRDRSDWKLLAWVEEKSKTISLANSESAIVDAWLKSGRSEVDITKKLFKLSALDEYELELLEKAEIQHDSCKRFLQQAKTLLGENKFHILLSEAKAEKMEGRQAKNPTGAFIWRVLNQIEQTK